MEDRVVRRKRRTIWKYIVRVLSCIVVFCTTYALILPAITMETKTYCGYEEHSHSDECYQTELQCAADEEASSTAHEHQSECYKEERRLICDLQESDGHTHTEECMQNETKVICGREEIAAHSHGDGCYEVVQTDKEEKRLICDLQESDGHTHTEECMQNETKVVCGQEEIAAHSHGDECYEVIRTLDCDMPTEVEKHIHTEKCYIKVLSCEKEEHQHTKICYSDKTADVETAQDWEKTLPDNLTDSWADNVLAVAQSQIGYKESVRNYIVDEDGTTKGYTRYGDWYGDSYGHWCAMFVSFCLNYAGVDETQMPYDSSCQNWIETLSEEKYEMYREAKEYEPLPGDLIFFNWDKLQDSDHVGLVYEVIEATEEHGVQIKTIEGNTSDTVNYRIYDIDDTSIMGYGVLPINPEEQKEENTQTTTEAHTAAAREEVPRMTFSLSKSANSLTGEWAKDILTVSKNELGNQGDKYIAWYNQTYGASISASNSHEAMAAFVSYCIVNAGIPSDVIPPGSNSNFDWINALEAAGVYRDRTSDYMPKPGDIVFGSTHWSGRNRADQVGIIIEVNGVGDWTNGTNLKVRWLNNGTVCEENTFNNFKMQANIAGFVEIPCGELSYEIAGVLKAKATFAIGAVENGAGLIVEIVGGSDWEDGVNSGVQTYGYEITKNHYLSVYFEKENEAGEKVKVEPTGPVDISIEFLTPLVSDTSAQTISEITWKYNLIDSSGMVATTNASYQIQTNEVNEITGLTLTYESAQAIVLSALREKETAFQVDTTLGRVTATCKTLNLPEDKQIHMEVSFLTENEMNASWTNAVEEKYLTEGYVIPTVKYFIIEFKDADNNKIAMPDDVTVDIIFDPPLSAVLESGLVSEEGGWKLDSVAVTDEGVALTEITTVTDMTEECALEHCSFTYEAADRYSLSAVVLDPAYGIEKYVKNYEELVDAIESSGSINTIITVTENFEANGPITIGDNKRIVVDLAGHRIHTKDTLFIVENAVFTLEDSAASLEDIRDEGVQSAGKLAEYDADSKTLTYYVTNSGVTNISTGETQETVKKHTVTLAGAIVGGDSPIIIVENTEKSVFNLNSGALTGSTNRAIVQKGGTVNLKGGYICGNSADSTECGDGVTCWNKMVSGGAVYVTGNSKLSLQSTVLAANQATQRGGAIAVESNDSPVIRISGGVISGNSCTSEEASEKHSNSDSHLGGGGVFVNGNGTLYLTGGYITNNKVVATGYYDGGGGIYAKYGCRLNISGGYVTGNYAENNGGGIATSADIDMNGGYVNGNYAKDAEGGGIAVHERALAKIFAGYINNNISDTQEHWGGGGLFCANGSTLVMENSLVTENHACGYGGGVAGCSTGRVYLFVKRGAAIYQNTADGTSLSGSVSTKNEDHSYVDSAMLQYGFEDYFCALNSVVDNYMLGGNSANWKGSVDGVPVEAGEGDTLVASYIMLLKSHPDQNAIAAAQEKAKLYINGNYSNTHGGGVLANGYMIIGEESEIPVFSRIRLHASKELVGDGADAVALKEEQFEFVIKNADTERIVTTAKNNADGTITFDKLIHFNEEGTFTYLVYENQEYGKTDGILMDTAVYKITIKVNKVQLSDLASLYKRYHYKVSYIKIEKQNTDEWEFVSENNDPQYEEEYPLELELSEKTSFINQQVAETKISVLKKWVGIEPPSETVIQVQLYRDGIPQGDPVNLSKDVSWYYSWGKLPLYELDSSGNKKYYEYTVKEQGDTSGYQISYHTHNITEQKKAWLPQEGQLEKGEQYIILSGDGKHVLYLSNIYGYYNLGESDKQSIAKKTEALTVNGKEYTTYCLESEISEQSIYHADSEGGNLVFKYFGGAWGLLTAPNGTLKSSYDDSNLYVGDVFIGKGNQDSTAYKIVYDGNQFTTVEREVAHDNEARIYALVDVDKTTETVFAITNTKIPDEIFYKLDIKKMSASDENILLAGAQFELIPENEKEGITFQKVVSGKYEYCSQETEGASKTVETAFGGKLILEGIPAGKYILRETRAPNGYLPIEDKVILLEGSEDVSTYLEIVDEREEEQIFELPETGGTGTNRFMIGGCLLMAISLLGYSLRRRRKEVI